MTRFSSLRVITAFVSHWGGVVDAEHVHTAIAVTWISVVKEKKK